MLSLKLVLYIFVICCSARLSISAAEVKEALELSPTEPSDEAIIIPKSAVATYLNWYHNWNTRARQDRQARNVQNRRRN